ncbi:MAG: hypothetical protein CM1200mP20_13000 [Pseudomonadota bacterium]|nr:MAG: hypothetical protein CM1200mP20_13000 [Pseudomonadota bacterium]
MNQALPSFGAYTDYGKLKPSSSAVPILWRYPLSTRHCITTTTKFRQRLRPVGDRSMW